MRRVVVVDDDPFMLELVRRVLGRLGMADIELLVDPGGLLPALADRGDSADLLILDLSMPGIDGVSLLRPLARQGYAGGVILLSGASADVLDMAMQLGRASGLNMLGSLPKPPQPDALSRLLQSRKPAEPRAPAPAVRCPSAHALLDALRAGQIGCAYQPKVNLRDGRVVGLEALARWYHPVHGTIPPTEFIALAERQGMITELTRSVLDQSLARLKSWRQDGLNLQMAVNVSAQDLCEPGFVDAVAQALQMHRISPSALCLEVTESQLGQDPLLLIESLTRLRLKGVRLSIDDFGSGYSSMLKLRDTVFDELKIDRGFTHDAASEPRRAAMFRLSAQAARALGVQVVAEGIENRADWNFSLGNGASIGQGYFISPPLPPEHIATWARDWASDWASDWVHDWASRPPAGPEDASRLARA